MVDAGLALAEHTGLSDMSVNLIVDAAGVAKGTIFHHFGDRAGFLVTLHRRVPRQAVRRPRPEERPGNSKR